MAPVFSKMKMQNGYCFCDEETIIRCGAMFDDSRFDCPGGEDNAYASLHEVPQLSSTTSTSSSTAIVPLAATEKGNDVLTFVKSDLTAYIDQKFEELVRKLEEEDDSSSSLDMELILSRVMTVMKAEKKQDEEASKGWTYLNYFCDYILPTALSLLFGGCSLKKSRSTQKKVKKLTSEKPSKASSLVSSPAATASSGVPGPSTSNDDNKDGTPVPIGDLLS